MKLPQRIFGFGVSVMMCASIGACVSVDIDTERSYQTSKSKSQEPSVVQTIPEAPDRSEILSVVDIFFEALALRDADVFENLYSEDARSVTTFPETPERPIRYGRMADTAAAMRAGRLPKIEEPYWSPIVLQRGNLAVVWAPYEVWVDETLSHCGIDVFNMSRHMKDGKSQWLIDSIHWTQEPNACMELWPDGRSVLRPNMFSQGTE